VVFLDIQVYLAIAAIPVFQVGQGILVFQAIPVIKVSKAYKAYKAYRAYKAHLVIPV
jgi:hypothetical protein